MLWRWVPHIPVLLPLAGIPDESDIAKTFNPLFQSWEWMVSPDSWSGQDLPKGNRISQLAKMSPILVLQFPWLGGKKSCIYCQFLHHPDPDEFDKILLCIYTHLLVFSVVSCGLFVYVYVKFDCAPPRMLRGMLGRPCWRCASPSWNNMPERWASARKERVSILTTFEPQRDKYFCN